MIIYIKNNNNSGSGVISTLTTNLVLDAPAKHASARRIVALDALRGMLTIMVVFSHFFAELAHGVSALAFGWLAVNGFFVLSGFLIGRLILDKAHTQNFFQVFYIRRICRTFPIYFFCIIVIFAIEITLHPPDTGSNTHNFGLLTYLTFLQNFSMSFSDSIGLHWISPTWTLAVEEQYYLLAPAALVFTPRRYLVHLMIFFILIAFASRGYILFSEQIPFLAAQVLLITNMDLLALGMLASILIRYEFINWDRLDNILRILPLILLLVMLVIYAVLGKTYLASWLVQPLSGLAFAALILSLVRGAPETQTYKSEFLLFFGNISYAVYLTHLAVLGLLHHFVLNAAPDLVNWQQWLVTLTALPITVIESWVLTKVVEEPITAYGRSFKWKTA